MKFKAFYSIVAILVIAVIVGIFVVNKKQTPEKIAEPQKNVRIGYLTNIGAADHFIAKNKGLYEKFGLKVEATELSSSNQAYDAVVQGNIDIVPDLSSVPILVNQIKDPEKVKIFRTDLQYRNKPFDQIIVMPTSPIKSPADLAGKKIGVFPGSTATAFLKDYLANKKDVDISKTEFIQIPPPDQLAALEAGSIDALYAYESDLTYALVKMNARTIGEPIQSWSVEGNPIAVGIISSKFLQNDPDLAKKIIDIYDQTNDFLTTDDAETRQILIKELQLDPEVAQKVSLNYHSDSKKIDKDAYKKLVDQLVTFGVLESQPDLSNIFYN